ncbi:MAG: hypothetical protein IJL89_10260 [Firmicutes bacterium]|nr:hypothetical protein [Bacillota bacterium]
MTKSESLHQLYKECMDIEFDESSELVKNAETEDERKFIKTVTDFVLQTKQKAAIAEKRF